VYNMRIDVSAFLLCVPFQAGRIMPDIFQHMPLHTSSRSRRQKSHGAKRKALGRTSGRRGGYCSKGLNCTASGK
jgi:hypothetical protein